MEREMDEDDLYAVLGIEGGDAAVSQVDLRRAYRGLALLWHPDKQAGKTSAATAAAALEFEKIQRAHEVLGDEKARKAYDELRALRKSRLEREKQLSSKRQKMMQELRHRERAFGAERAREREEEMATKRLQAEIARIRAQSKRQTASAEGLGQSQTGQAMKTRPTPAQAAQLQRTLKVTWISTEGGSGGYTATRLREIFEEFGGVDDVVIRERKGKTKGSALVVMSSGEAAVAATNVACGDFSNPLLAVPVLTPTSTRAEPEVSFQAEQPAKADDMINVIGTGYRSNENEILKKMRQAAERARIIKEMQEKEAQE